VNLTTLDPLARALLEHVATGDRVLQVGIGAGYLKGVLLRESRLAYYCGVESPFDVTEAFIAEHRPTLALLIDVLDRIEDPQLALHSIAAVAADEALFVLSVKAPGLRDLRHLCARAGLSIHHQQSVPSVGLLLIASPGRAAPRRLLSGLDGAEQPG
jgi:hypothetical protein